MKKTISTFLLALLLFFDPVISISADDAQTYDPYATAESLGLEPYVLPDDFYPVYPWDWFPAEHLPYETMETSLPGNAECGFNFAGFVKPEDLYRCDALGLKAMVPAQADWANLSDEQIDAHIRDVVEKSKGHECVIGYYLIDEPGAKLFPALGKAVAAVKKHAPGKIAYINLFPRYATTDTVENPHSQLQTKSFTEYLERYVQEVKPQFISYDNYMVEYSDDMQDVPKADVYYGDLLQIREISLKYKIPFWNIVSCNRIQTLTPPPSPARFAFQAYTTLATGGRGLGWFIYYYRDFFSHAPIDKEGRRTLSWLYLQAMNRQITTLGPIMNRLQSTGVYFTTPTPTPNLPEMPGKLVIRLDVTASPRNNIDTVPPFMVGEFVCDDGCDYVMLVNLSLEYSARFHMETAKSYKNIVQISPMDGSASPLVTDDSGEWILPGHGMLLKFEQ